jgi:transposase
MSLRPQAPPPVPEETARLARAAFPAGNLAGRLRDALDTLDLDEQLQALVPVRGQPAEAPWRLALVTLVQLAEDLADRQAADAVRSRIDLKSLLAVDLTDPGFDHTGGEFRQRLLDGEVDRLLLDPLLDRCRTLGLLQARGRQRTDSTHILAAVRGLTRLEVVRETMRQPLDDLAELAPSWLAAHADPAWVKRDRGRSDGGRLPDSTEARRALAETIGDDGFRRLAAVGATDAPAWRRTAAPLEQIRRTWLQTYRRTEAGVRWRTAEDGFPKAHDCVSSPLDPDARLGQKHDLVWVGDKVALTETCEDDPPNLITHVETTAAPVADGAMTPRIHGDLPAQDRLPAVHLVDTGFLDAELLVTSRAE